MTKKLPKTAKDEINNAYKGSKSTKEQRRIQVLRLLSRGYSHKQVSDIVGVSRDQIRELVTKYNKQGIDGLRLKPHPKNNARLSDLQKDKIKKLVHKYDRPSDAGVKVAKDSDYWSLETLRLLVKQKWDVEYRSGYLQEVGTQDWVKLAESRV